MDQTSLHQDRTFKRIVVGSTGLGLACMLGSVAAIRISEHALQFQWHWSIIVLAAAVMLWNSRFWSIVWELQEKPAPATKRKLGIHLGILLGLGAGSFLYPIRFIEQSYWNEILRGLMTAFAFLGIMVWLIYKCGKGLAEIDAAELKRHG